MMKVYMWNIIEAQCISTTGNAMIRC